MAIVKNLQTVLDNKDNATSTAIALFGIALFAMLIFTGGSTFFTVASVMYLIVYDVMFVLVIGSLIFLLVTLDKKTVDDVNAKRKAKDKVASSKRVFNLLPEFIHTIMVILTYKYIPIAVSITVILVIMVITLGRLVDAKIKQLS